MAKKALFLNIEGLVHGVAFRATMLEVAKQANVTGWVRNVPGGSVEAFIEGEEEDVERVLAWSRRGPPRARVDSVKVEPAGPRGLKRFEIAG